MSRSGGSSSGTYISLSMTFCKRIRVRKGWERRGRAGHWGSQDCLTKRGRKKRREEERKKQTEKRGNEADQPGR